MKDFEQKFVEIEKRVKAMAAENRSLNVRVKELEAELLQARRAARDAEQLRGKQLSIRDRIERVLRSLESVEEREGAEKAAGPESQSLSH